MGTAGLPCCYFEMQSLRTHMLLPALLLLALLLPAAKGNAAYKKDNQPPLQLAIYCAEKGGEMVERLTCSESQKKRRGWFCEIEKNKDRHVFFNGCTRSILGFGRIFFHACVRHDMCYHHEPATSGRSRKDCDARFYRDLLAVCDGRKNRFYCQSVAGLFYRGVREFGESSFRCANTEYDYEAFLID